MKLNRDRLEKACFETARSVMWAQRPVSADAIQALAFQFLEHALSHEEFVVGQGRDPNLITAAVLHLNHRHAIPPMETDTRWFSTMLHVLVELCCPNTGSVPEEVPFFRELETGIAEARADLAG